LKENTFANWELGLFAIVAHLGFVGMREFVQKTREWFL
jgi:hypothetical protein